MLNLYRRIGLSSRLLALGLVEALTFAIVLRNYPLPTLLPIMAAVAGVLVLLDITIRRGALLLAAFVSVLQAVVITYAALSIDTLGAAAGDTSGFTFLFFQLFGIFVLLVHITLAIYVARGRIWVNIAVASLLFDFGFVALVSFLLLPLYWSVLAALGLTLLYFAARAIRWRKEAPYEVPPRSKATVERTKKFAQEQQLTLLEVSDTEHVDAVAVAPGAVYLISAIELQGQLTVKSTGLEADGQDLTPLLEIMAKGAKRFSRRYRLPRQRVYAIMLAHKTGLNPPLRTVRIRSRKSPDRVLGSVLIANQKGVQRLIKTTSQFRPLSARRQTRLSS